MIRYAISLAELEDRVDLQAGGWREEAEKRKKVHTENEGYSEPPKPNWGDVKPVFTELQHGKCAYCESKPGKNKEIKIQWDLEHYRPKGAVKAWPSASMKKKEARLNYAFGTGDEQAKGYFLLAYDLRNYAAGCKPCNSTLKRDYFPVAEPRHMKVDDFTLLAQEEPLLLFPIGDWGVDPAEYLSFNGTIPIAIGNTPLAKKKGQVTIDFFRLETREELREQRSEVITKIWLAHIAIANGAMGADLDLAQSTLDMVKSDACRHALCARTFLALVASDEASARMVAVEADKFLRSKHPTI